MRSNEKPALPRRPRHGSRSALLALAALALAAPLLAPTAGAAAHPSYVTANFIHLCPTLNYSHTAQRIVDLANPTFPMAAGDSLGASYEVRIISTTITPIAVAVHVPELFVKFPLSNGSTVAMNLSAHVFNLKNTVWTKTSLTTNHTVLNASATFSTSLMAEVTSELVGVMANASYGNVTLGFRWQWSATFASNNSTFVSPFSTMVRGGSEPTIFDPAPYVQLVSTSNATAAPIGTTFYANLAGAVVNTRFISELEFKANGHVVWVSTADTTNNTTAPFAFGVPVLAHSAPLGPALMLDHVRNVCGALLYIIPVQTVYAHNVSVQVTTNVKACGTIVVNGTSYARGATAHLNASASPVPISVPACTGHAFHIWTYSQGAYIGVTYRNATTALISAGGNLTAKFF